MRNGFEQAVNNQPSREHLLFNESFDALLTAINFDSKKQAIEPENVELTKQAFFTFFKKMDWPLATWSFEALLEEKTGKHAYRADGKTPNWYHEAKEVLYRCSKVRAGLTQYEKLEELGGLEVGVSIDLRHDSWEDLGHDKLKIYTYYEKRIHDVWGNNGHDDAYYFMLRQKATMIANGIDNVTRKIPRRDEFGRFVLKDKSDKYQKDPRFEDDLNLYMDHVLLDPNTIENKMNDGIEGMSSRNHQAYTDDVNRGYNEERRRLYGRRAIADEACEKFPFIEKSIRASDSMLGINLVIMESVVDYGEGGANPKHARPIDIKRYLPVAKGGFELLGPAWHPVTGSLEDLEDKAAKETNMRTSLLLQNALYPALKTHFPMPYNHIDREKAASTYLPERAAYAPNMA